MPRSSRDAEPEPKAGTVRRMSILSRLHGNTQRVTNQGTWVFGMLWFDTDLGMDNVKKIVQEKLLTIPRFRSAMQMKRGKERFVELSLDDIDYDYHVKHVTRSLTKDQVYDEWISNIETHFQCDMNKPLWQLTYFDDVEGQHMLLTNIHHAIGDGVSIIEVLMRMLDQDQGKSQQKRPAEETPQANTESVARLEGPKSPPPKPRKKRSAPFGPLNKARIFLGGCIRPFFSAFGKADTPSPLMRKNFLSPSTSKSTAFTEQIDLAAVKEIKDKFPGATVNDICVALLNLTLAAYLREIAETDPSESRRREAKALLDGKGLCRSSFPINNRKKGAKDAFRDHSPHNKIALGALQFNFRYKSRTDLVWRFKRTLDSIKLSPEPLVQGKLGNLLMSILSKKAMVDMLQKVGCQNTAMLSNVQAPAKKVTLAGHTVQDLTFALYSGNGMYLGLLSYNQKISVCVCLDAELGDAKRIAKHWKTEFDMLYSEALSYDGPVPRNLGCTGCLDRL